MIALSIVSVLAVARPTAAIALGLFASDPGYDYGPLLREIAATGAEHVQIDVVWLQSDVRAHDIAPDRTVSPDDNTVRRTLLQAKALGLTTTLFPIVRPRRHGPKEWRGVFDPAAGAARWFQSYRGFVLHIARLAHQGDAARLSVGSELCSLEHEEAHWRALIQAVRGEFRGRLTYSANWDQLDRVQFWDALDDVGVTAYFELAGAQGDEVPGKPRGEPRPQPPTQIEDLRSRWRAPRAQLQRLRERTQRPLWITEIGYPSHADAARVPWDETRAAPVDLALQARLFRAACVELFQSGAVDGLTIWNWFGHGGETDTGYSPRKKPAAREIGDCFRH
jgi:hypothetical protein